MLFTFRRSCTEAFMLSCQLRDLPEFHVPGFVHCMDDLVLILQPDHPCVLTDITAGFVPEFIFEAFHRSGFAGNGISGLNILRANGRNRYGRKKLV